MTYELCVPLDYMRLHTNYLSYVVAIIQELTCLCARACIWHMGGSAKEALASRCHSLFTLFFVVMSLHGTQTLPFQLCRLASER